MCHVRIMKNIDAHRGPIVTMTINHRLMYTGSADGTAKCWVTEFGDNTQVYRGHGMSVTAVKFYKGLGEHWAARAQIRLHYRRPRLL